MNDMATLVEVFVRETLDFCLKDWPQVTRTPVIPDRSFPYTYTRIVQSNEHVGLLFSKNPV
jgi:hypothetical protein